MVEHVTRPATPLRRLPAVLAAALLLLLAAPTAAVELTVEPAGASLAGGDLHLTVTVEGAAPGAEIPVAVEAAGRSVGTVTVGAGESTVKLEDAGLATGRPTVTVGADGARAETRVRVLPGWTSLLPPLVAIGLALVFKDVLLSLFCGVFVGALLLTGFVPWSAFARSIDGFALPALADPDHATIIMFSLLLGGMVGVISKSGGSRGIVAQLTGYATDSRRGQLATWAMGVLVFFDDYANTLIVGSTMRPIADRLRISREKLAYIVDSTAAPVASLVPISTWIGFEVGLIATALADLGLDYNAYNVFVASIPYRFYPLFALALGFTIAVSGRDLGPMLAAERRAVGQGKVLADGDTPLADYQSEALEPPAGTEPRAANALLPILTVIAVTVGGLYVTGAAAVEAAGGDGSNLAGLRQIFSQSDSFSALLWASLSGVVVAVALPLVQGILSVKQSMEAVLTGMKSMLLAMVVLVLAWSIGAVCGELHTAEYLVGATSGELSPVWMPALTFALSAAIAFATGTSWGAMGILMPLVIPVVHGISVGAGYEAGSAGYTTFLVGTVSSVLAGTVWGDHCSPISDTTILSSMASGSDHIAHVRTQLPYALSLGLLGMAIGDIPSALGLSPWISLAVGGAVIVAVVRLWGKASGEPEGPATA